MLKFFIVYGIPGLAGALIAHYMVDFNNLASIPYSFLAVIAFGIAYGALEGFVLLPWLDGNK